MPAPFVLAKGAGNLADRIVAAALECGVHIVPDKELIDSLYEIEIGEIIPEELFQVVAALLAFVYRTQTRL